MLGRREGPAGAGRTVRVVAVPEAGDDPLRVRQRAKPMRIEAFITQATVESLDGAF